MLKIECRDPQSVPQLTDALLNQFSYQPFEFPDGTVTGSGAALVTRATRRVLRPDERDDLQAASFLDCNKRLANMYEDFISAMIDNTPSIEQSSYLDFACNAGYFCYRMLQEGFKRSLGVDARDHGPAFDYVRDAAGLNAEFKQSSYNMLTHTASSLGEVDEKFDWVSCIAFMCHSSDPQYLLTYLASMTRKGILIFTKIHRSDEYSINFGKESSRYFGGKFPICFDTSTSISDSLLIFGLQELGFKRIVEVERKPYWILHPEWRCFYALREE